MLAKQVEELRIERLVRELAETLRACASAKEHSSKSSERDTNDDKQGAHVKMSAVMWGSFCVGWHYNYNPISLTVRVSKTAHRLNNMDRTD
jgi:hypothetical protein